MEWLVAAALVGQLVAAILAVCETRPRPNHLRDPVGLVVIAAGAWPPLEPYDGDLVVPANTVEQVDDITRETAPRPTDALSGVVLGLPSRAPKAVTALRTGRSAA